MKRAGSFTFSRKKDLEDLWRTSANRDMELIALSVHGAHPPNGNADSTSPRKFSSKYEYVTSNGTMKERKNGSNLSLPSLGLKVCQQTWVNV